MEMLKMWTPKGTQSLTFPLLKAHFGQNMFKTGEMLKTLNLLSQKVLKTGEMLKMLEFFGEPQDTNFNIWGSTQKL